MQISLASKVIVVTGASSGIGLAVTRTFLDCGAAGIIAVFRRKEIPEELLAAQRLHPGKLHIVHGDVAEEQTAIVHQSAQASGDPEGYWSMLRNAHPIGRIANAEEVAGFYAYMASDLATFFTGAVVMMDGGYTAQ